MDGRGLDGQYGAHDKGGEPDEEGGFIADEIALIEDLAPFVGWFECFPEEAQHEGGEVAGTVEEVFPLASFLTDAEPCSVISVKDGLHHMVID